MRNQQKPEESVPKKQSMIKNATKEYTLACLTNMRWMSDEGAISHTNDPQRPS